jgi:hypothetical protein
MRPGFRGPRLPRTIGRTGRPDHPPTAGLDGRSSFLPGYNPAIGIFPTMGFLMQESSEFLLQEDGHYILL